MTNHLTPSTTKEEEENLLFCLIPEGVDLSSA